ncbi:MAG: hypothetical protein J6C98_00100 [Oscillospiraceae bacterium]|nr:hypothetical protein [Oscillospiraceae bacterium]
MEGTYELAQGSKTIGTVTVRRQGLYHSFSCRCDLTGAVVYRLMVTCGGRQENLGVLVPVDGSFGLEKRIPVKYFGEGVPLFQLQAVHDRAEGKFVPIYPDEPFAYLAKLKDAFLERQSGQLGIVIKQ